MEPKPFAVGLRVEHPQSMINMDLMEKEENEFLGAASYKVTHTCEKWTRSIFFLYVSGWICRECLFGTGKTGSQWHELSGRVTVKCKQCLIVFRESF